MRPKAETVGDDVATLLRRHPRVSKVLNDHGISFCAGCYLTLTAAPAKAAAYHGVPNVPRFLRALERIVAASPKRRRPRR